MGALHYGFCPIIIIRIRTAADLLHSPFSIVIPHIGLISAVKICIIFRGHIAAAAPVFIANAKVVHLPRLFASVFAAQVGHGRYPVKGHVLYPFRHFLHSAAAHVAIDIGLTAKLLTKLHEFMGTKAVVLQDAAPVGVDHFFAAFFGANAVLPVIFVSKASARPAEYRDFHIPKSLNNIVSHTIFVGNFRIFPYIKSLVNTSAKVLGKVTIDVFTDPAQHLIFVNE